MPVAVCHALPSDPGLVIRIVKDNILPIHVLEMCPRRLTRVAMSHQETFVQPWPVLNTSIFGEFPVLCFDEACLEPLGGLGFRVAGPRNRWHGNDELKRPGVGHASCAVSARRTGT